MYRVQRNGQTLPTHVQALAILIPHNRQYSTETSTSSGSGNSFPPPGFNAEQAKKPLPQDAPRKAAESSSTAASGKSKSEAHEFAVKDGEKIILTEQGSAEAAVAEEAKRVSAEKKEEKKKMTIMQKVKHEIQHYWDGTKLLATEVRISMKLAIKMAAGYELSRRENRQVSVTQDAYACFSPIFHLPVLILDFLVTAVTTNGEGFGATCPIFCLCDCSIR